MKKFALLLMAVATTLILTACSYNYDFKVDEEGNLTGSCVCITMADDIRTLMAVEARDSLFTDKYYWVDFDDMCNQSDEYLTDVMITYYNNGDAFCQEKTKINGELAVTNTWAFGDTVTEALRDSGAYTWNSTKFVYTSTIGNTFIPFERKLIVADKAADFSRVLGRKLGSHEKAFVNTIQQNFVVTLPSKIVYTNGELSNDGRTVTWSADKFTNDDELFAYTADAEEVAGMVFDNTADDKEVEELVILTNVKKGNVIYKKSAKVTALSKIKAIYVNGKKIKSKSKVTFAEDGEYTIKVKTADYTKTIVVTKKTKKSN